jgi:hypothetical protein
LDRELAGQSTNDLEFIEGSVLSLLLLYCLHIERHEDQLYDFNIHCLRGWRYGEMIIALAEKNGCPLYEAWQYLMQTRFHVREAEDRQVVDLTNDHEVINLTKDHEVIDLTGED